MLNQIYNSVSYGLEETNQKFNSILDNTIERINTSFLPNEFGEKILNEYSSESRILAIWLLNTTFLAFTVCNPLLPSAIGIPLGIFSVQPSVKSLYVNTKEHIQTCKKELPPQERNNVTVILTSLIAVQIFGLYLERDKPSQSLMAIALAFTYATGCLSITTNSILLSGKRKLVEFEQKIMGECKLLTNKIETLKEHVQKLDGFIKRRPELYNLINKQLEIQKDLVGIDLEPIDHEFNPDNIIDTRTKLSIELLRREYYLDKRISFIKRNEEIYECFLKYVEAQNNGSFDLLIHD